MKFQKGQPRPPNAGRKKGTLNKKRIPSVADYLAEKDLSPVKKILDILENEDLKPRDKAEIWLDLLSYCQSKPKQIDQDADAPSSDEELLDQFKEVSNETLLKLVKGPIEGA